MIEEERVGGVVMLGGIPYETIYWYTLLICAGLALLLVIFGDVLDFDGALDPMLVVPWLAFTSLFGYLGEHFTEFSSTIILVVSVIISTILVFLLNFYVLMPLKHAESTLSSSEKDLEGRVALVLTPIPVSGMGEVQLKNVTGSISRPACFYSPQETAAERGTEVLIIEVNERICYVVPYKGILKG
ncbi:hypothetical protein D920_02591 [Enterococcus faecalis 13-SD-W-01]|jgi:membrane protein implicated in regulation of membrane protease activity|nr:hypothetical protein D920_02591 [Enterococcus faecalis 13-SD-W-01]